MEKLRIDIYFDGACKNVKDSKEEFTGVGVAVYIGGEFSELFSKAEKGDLGTSNVAEYCALRLALHTVKEIQELLDGEEVDFVIYSDSQLVCRQISMYYEVRDENLKKYYKECLQLIREVGVHKLVWLKREQNKEADRLSKIGLSKNK